MEVFSGRFKEFLIFPFGAHCKMAREIILPDSGGTFEPDLNHRKLLETGATAILKATPLGDSSERTVFAVGKKTSSCQVVATG